jgi:hypothetical protein
MFLYKLHRGKYYPGQIKQVFNNPFPVGPAKPYPEPF